MCLVNYSKVKLSDVDLQAFALADNVCCKPALHERAIRVLDAAQRDLRPLSSLIRPAVGDDPSPSGTYKTILRKLYETQQMIHMPMLPTDPSALALLNQSLTQITTDFLAEEALRLRALFQRHIEGEGIE